MKRSDRTPARPRDAASLLIYRRRGSAGRGGLEVLMGRRRRSARFTPGVYVFPGGRLEPDDRRARPATRLSTRGFGAFRSRAHAQALAMTAVRETAEETGLVLGVPGSVGPVGGGWEAFRATGVAPALHRLHYIGRAITPTDSPWRYHARFFMVDARHLRGTLAGDGELLDLRWVNVDGSMAARLIDVTEAMLAEVRPRLADPGRLPLFLSYREQRCYLRRERSRS